MLNKKTSTCLSVFDLQRPSRDAHKTIVCLGTPRGGTSMVGGVIAACGVFMGHDLPANIEDPDFNRDVHRDMSAEAFKATLPGVIQARNREHSVWGWKYPRAASYLEDIISELRNPYLVIVHRDPVPATIRSEPEDDRAVLKELRRRLRMELDNLQLAQRLKCPSLLVSYERSIRNPEGFIKQLTDFLGIAPPSDLTAVLAFMEPGSYKRPLK